MDWPLEKIGAGAIIFAGYNFKEYARHSIQDSSKEVEREISYSHLGWVEHDGRWVFVHAGGVIGADRAKAEGLMGPETTINGPNLTPC